MSVKIVYNGSGVRTLPFLLNLLGRIWSLRKPSSCFQYGKISVLQKWRSSHGWLCNNVLLQDKCLQT
ncbi:hypothetical protein RHMOL_Rhmol13G0141100 [Rhododendron molle]|uniref:Uncharacterized protein n=1 Tax=Rhododendron molle TaxID=49168 RepID=A0ACC0L835_RHOML|nr:hypothetical protein RHMOL_Rhmol13G0141100 [Rhododendron molle]